jgi:hypothetical protein
VVSSFKRFDAWLGFGMADNKELENVSHAAPRSRG